MQLDVAKNDNGVVRIISFESQPIAIAVRCNAAVPFETVQAYLEPNILFNFFSNLSIVGP